MSKMFATGGSKLYIGGPKAFAGSDLVAADFNGESWVEIKGATNLGSAGDTSELISANIVSENRTRKLKGTRNAGSMAVVVALDYSDAGQLAVLAAEKERHSYAFRVVFNDAPPGGTPSVRYFVAYVMSAAEQWDEANSVMNLNATLEIDSNIVRVNAGAGGGAPANSVLPAITGTATEGQTLTASSGTWTGTPTPALSYQWFADGESLPGQTDTTLVLTGDHVGAVISVLVTAVNIVGTAHAMSAGTSAVASE